MVEPKHIKRLQREYQIITKTYKDQFKVDLKVFFVIYAKISAWRKFNRMES